MRKHRRRRNIKSNVLVQTTKSAGSGARIYEKLSIDFKRFELMCVTRHENVDVELSLQQRQAALVAPRHDLVTVAHADFEVGYLDDLCLWIRRVFVKVAARDVHVTGDRFQIVERLLATQIARTQNVLYLSGHLRTGSAQSKSKTFYFYFVDTTQ
jgi:hypothetical protein